MKTTLDLPNGKILLGLSPGDSLTPATVQRMLRAGSVPFTTISVSGLWQISASDALALSDAMAGWPLEWEPEAELHLGRLKTHADERKGVERTLSYDRHQDEWIDEIGMTPYDEQLDAARYMSAPGVDRFALFWKPGTGKTGALLTGAHELVRRGTVKGVLIVAERPSAILDPWKREINNWLSPESLSGGVEYAKGTKRERLHTYLRDPTWLVVHYGLLWSDQAAIIKWARRVSAEEPPIVIFDESDLVKNPDANRSKAAMYIRQNCGRCWIGSGTPAPHSPKDYEHQMSLLYGFRLDLGLSGSQNDDLPVVVHELDKGAYYLQQENPRKQPETHRVLKVELTSSQRRAYTQMEARLRKEVIETSTSLTVTEVESLTRSAMGLYRVCSDPAHSSLGRFDFSTPAKFIEIDRLLEEILDGESEVDEKVVIWSRFRSTAQKLQDRYKEKYGAVLLAGGSSGASKDLRKAEVRVLVSTIQMGASSIDLTPARNAIYESLDDVPRNFVQSMARINRTGQAYECRYWFLVAADTIEETQADRVLQTSESAERLFAEIGSPGRGQLVEQLRDWLKKTDTI